MTIHNHHNHSHPDNERTLRWVLTLTVGFMFCEYAGGYFANSLSLMSDASHMLTDGAALALTLLAVRMSRRAPTRKHTFGLQRLEGLGALLNGLLLLVLSGFILWDAWVRLANPPPVHLGAMFWVGLLGLTVNVLSGYLLMKAAEANLAIRGALLHVLGDALGSVGVIVASALIAWKGWLIADPIVSIIVALLIVVSTFRLLNEAVHLMLEGVPAHIDLETLEKDLLGLPGVAAIHDLHVWSVRSGQPILTCHLVEKPSKNPSLLADARALIKAQYGINHSTLQIEASDLNDGCS